jgi:hypothetical protein
MGEPGHIVVAQGCDKDLRLMLQAAERLTMDDAVAVALELSPHGAGLLIALPAPGPPALCGIRGEAFLPFLKSLADIVLKNRWWHFHDYVACPAIS